MQLHCPHCRNPITLTAPEAGGEIVCPACGSTFRLDEGATTGWTPSKYFGKYEVLEMVGQGGFGTVYKAFDPELDRVVALKVPRSGNLSGPHELKRFLREGRSAAQLRHPGIVSIHEVGTSDAVPFLVSDFVTGVTLADWLSAHRATFPHAARLVARLADTLHYAHEQGVVHRDVKPANIMLERRQGKAKQGEEADGALSAYEPRLMDFGLAKREAGEITVTIDGQVIGTPAYMSPEQARGESHLVDGRSDTYSLGVILYQLLTGELPFRGTPRMLLHQVMHDEPRRPRSLNDHIPRDLETICLKAMAKEPGRRYATAQELGDDLRRFLKGEPIVARPVGRLERTWRWAKRRPAVAGLLAGLVLVLAISLPGLTTLWIQANEARKDVERERDAVAGAKNIAEKAKEAAEKDREASRLHLYGAQASLIQMAWRDRAAGRVQQLLEAQAPKDNGPDLRGFEYHYFRRVVEASQITLTGHTDTVLAVAFSPDNRYLASGSRDGTVKIWELATRLELRTLTGHADGVAGVTFSPDGRRLVSVAQDGLVRVWETATDTELLNLPTQTAGPGSVAFSSDGKFLAVAGPAAVTIWDETGKEVFAFTGHGQAVTAAAFSPDGKQVASAGADGMVRVWESSSGKEQYVLRVNVPILRLAFLLDGRYLTLGTPTGGQFAWPVPPVPSGKPLTVFPGYGNEPAPSAVSPDARQLAYLAPRDTVRFLDTNTSRELFALRRHAASVTSMAFNATGTRFATGGADRAVKVWAISFDLNVVELPGHRGEVFALAYSPNGEHLATAGDDGTLRVRESSTGQEVHLLNAHRADVRRGAQAPDAPHFLQGTCAVAYSKDGQRLATGGADGMVRTWDAAAGKRLRDFVGHKDAVTGVAFSLDGKLLASSSWDRTVKLWDAATGQLLHTLGHNREATAVAFSPQGQLLASASWDQKVRLWDAATGKEVRSFTWVSEKGRVDPLSSLAFDRDGTHLAVVSDPYGGGGWIKVYNLALGAEVESIQGHIYGILGVCFSPDGKRLASVSCDGGAIVWDLATGQELLAFHNRGARGREEEVAIDSRRDAMHAITFSPDGRRLALACRNSKVLLLDAAAPTPELLLEREAYRVVHSLFEQRVTQAAVLEHLAGDHALSPKLREAALARAKRYCQNASLLNDQSWRVVSRPGGSPSAYQRALLQAQEACRLLPKAGALLNTLGVAQYRAGQFEAAVQSLTESDRIQSAQLKSSHPADLAFLAMAHHQLGKHDEAQSVLSRLRQLLKEARWAKDKETVALAQEAEALLQGKGAVEKKAGP